MELVEGPTLAATIEHEGALDPRRALRIAVQIARPLREAHSLRVIHRDLKRANVILARHGDEDSFVKLLDFGLVKDLHCNEGLTEPDLLLGSPKYMHVARTDPAGTRSPQSLPRWCCNAFASSPNFHGNARHHARQRRRARTDQSIDGAPGDRDNLY